MAFCSNQVYSFDAPYRQVFSLPKPVMTHVMNEWKHEVYSKLVQTCKLLFSQHRIIVVDNILVKDKYVKTSQRANIFSILLKSSCKYWVMNQLIFCQNPSDIHFVDVFEGKYRFDLKILQVYNTKLSYAEYQILTASHNISSLALCNSFIVNENDQHVSIADICKQVPNIVTLGM